MSYEAWIALLVAAVGILTTLITIAYKSGALVTEVKGLREDLKELKGLPGKVATLEARLEINEADICALKLVHSAPEAR